MNSQQQVLQAMQIFPLSGVLERDAQTLLQNPGQAQAAARTLYPAVEVRDGEVVGALHLDTEEWVADGWLEVYARDVVFHTGRVLGTKLEAASAAGYTLARRIGAVLETMLPDYEGVY